MSHRVLYYTLDGDTRRADELLSQMGVSGQIELVGCSHEVFVPPTAAQLVGCTGFIGEFAPVLGETVDAMAAAGVRVAASMSIGMNHMDVAGLRARGIAVANCPGYCAEDVATHAIALMLDLMRKVTFTNRATVAGGWDPKGCYQPYRTQGRTLGLVFFGRIAREVVPIAHALGMRVLVWAPTKGAGELAAAGCRKAETLDELLVTSDVVSLHCPLILQTEGLIGARELALMKSTAYLVNTARGPLVDEDALAAALDAAEEGRADEPIEVEGVRGTRGIRAAGLDVLASETHPNRRLIEHPRCIVTPHAAYDSAEAADNLRRMSLESVCHALVGQGDSPSVPQ